MPGGTIQSMRRDNVCLMAEVKRSDSFLLSLSNEKKNLIPELPTAMPTLPTLQLVL